MNRKLAITILLTALLSVGIVGQAIGQARLAGVTGTDYFTYSITSTWKSENTSEPAPAGLAQWNDTKQYKVEIGLVQDTNVTSTQIWDLKNGTELPYLITIDIESGTPYYLSGSAPPFEGIVAANLNAGDLLHPAGNTSVVINQTTTRTYAGGTRTTNIIDLNSPIENETTNPTTNETTIETIGSQDVTYYIDRATGMLVEQKTVFESFTPKETATITWNLKETNVWDASPPINTIFIIVPAIAIVIVVVAALLYISRKKLRRGKKTRK